MTIRANQLSNQALIMQQLQAAKTRVAKIQQENTNQTKNPPNTPQANNSQTSNNFEALNQTALMNLSDHKNLTAKLQTAQNEVQVHERLLGEFKASPTKQKPENKELKGNPVYEKLPDNIKNRTDVAQLVNSVPEEALLDPDKAVQSLVDQSLMGNKAAYQKLNEYSKTPFDQLQESASKGMETVVNSADGKPKVLEMVASVPTDKAGEAAAKLMNLAHKNPRAQKGIEKLIANGSVNFSKTANRAKEIDPGQAAKSINTLMAGGKLSKSDKKGAIDVLGQIAKESPTGAGSKDAAIGLTRAVKNESMDIAKTAAAALKDATLNGNTNAMDGLQKLSKCDDPSRAALALNQLGEIAKTGSGSSGEAMQTIKSTAQDPTANGKTRNLAVNLLGNIANTGGANGKEAVQTMSNIASNKSNPANAIAFNEIGKMNDSTLGINPTSSSKNIKKTQNLSDTETFKKVMATQNQLNAFAQQPTSFMNKLAMNFAPAV